MKIASFVLGLFAFMFGFILILLVFVPVIGLIGVIVNILIAIIAIILAIVSLVKGSRKNGSELNHGSNQNKSSKGFEISAIILSSLALMGCFVGFFVSFIITLESVNNYDSYSSSAYYESYNSSTIIIDQGDSADFDEVIYTLDSAELVEDDLTLGLTIENTTSEDIVVSSFKMNVVEVTNSMQVNEPTNTMKVELNPYETKEVVLEYDVTDYNQIYLELYYDLVDKYQYYDVTALLNE